MEFSLTEVASAIAVLIGLVWAVLGAYHKFVVAPLLQGIKDLSKDVKSVQIDHSGLNEMVKGLTDAINRVSRQLDRYEKRDGR